ncbi:GNAT family N-acetyltransferase [Streptomyces catenulae]|uniref:GNAT family N-acetyltransferase n=1 Tax=Streptomyces catenulae TaxID=66875 RepID=A0ABV2YY71_9ACTN|nr:GNAT family N-acetyltransferase [Streptomyces catenulae]
MAATRSVPRLHTARLLLREWQESDLAPWAAMNADPEVRRHLGAPLTRAQSDASVARFRAEFAERGYGWWAVAERASGAFLGFAGFDRVEEGSLPCHGVEVGWRLARHAWGHGYATEAGRACLDFGFTTLGLSEILALTTATNTRSRAVMERLGMVHDPADDHEDPTAPEGPRRAVVCYRIRA